MFFLANEFIWDGWSQFENVGNLEGILSQVGTLIYFGIIVLAVVFSGFKLVTAIKNLLSVDANNAALRVQYKNDVYEVFVGFFMLTAGFDIVYTIISKMFGIEVFSIVGAVNDNIKNKNFGDTSIINPIIEKIQGPVVWFFYILAGAGFLYFATIGVIGNMMKYFNSSEAHERSAYAKQIKNALFGILALIAVGTIMNFILATFGFTNIISF